MTGTSPEYQYHLKDHLGNVRTTFTTQRAVDNSIGTFEAANYNTEQSLFLRYDDARVINSTLFDHTYYHQTPPTAGAFSERLSGSANEKTGIARSISVMPGDTVNLTVYAKYVDPANSNNTAALTQFLAQIIAGTASAGTVIDGPNYSVNGITPFPYTGLAGEGNSTGTGPKAYLNYLVFDRNFVFVNGGYVQVSTAAREDGTNVPHQQLTAQVIITQPGYVYTYLSNESTSPIEVYFDDFTVQQIKSPVVQQEDFYPFGLKFNSYQREKSVPNTIKLFQGQEHVDDLGLNWDQFKWRNHQPDIGRFFNVDPLSEKYYYNSPYAFSENKVVAHVELEGLEAEKINAEDLEGAVTNGLNISSPLSQFHLDAEFKGDATNGVPFKFSKPESSEYLETTHMKITQPVQGQGGGPLPYTLTSEEKAATSKKASSAISKVIQAAKTSFKPKINASHFKSEEKSKSQQEKKPKSETDKNPEKQQEKKPEPEKKPSNATSGSVTNLSNGSEQL